MFIRKYSVGTAHPLTEVFRTTGSTTNASTERLKTNGFAIIEPMLLNEIFITLSC
jgi:hypothetical protein